MNNRSHILALFIDLSKALDLIGHDKILQSLYDIGVRGIYLQWFKSYLQNRKFRVKVGDTYSEVKDNNQGVPQRSQIGPILFLIHMNEIFGRIIECHIVAYDDDLLLIIGHKDLHVPQEKMQLDFNTLMKWARNKGLVINAQKTCMMHIFPKNVRFETEAKIKCHNCDCLNNVQIRNDCQCEKYNLSK